MALPHFPGGPWCTICGKKAKLDPNVCLCEKHYKKWLRKKKLEQINDRNRKT